MAVLSTNRNTHSRCRPRPRPRPQPQPHHWLSSHQTLTLTLALDLSLNLTLALTLALVHVQGPHGAFFGSQRAPSLIYLKFLIGLGICPSPPTLYRAVAAANAAVSTALYSNRGRRCGRCRGQEATNRHGATKAILWKVHGHEGERGVLGGATSRYWYQCGYCYMYVFM